MPPPLAAALEAARSVSNIVWISSSVRPLVSGTHRAIQMNEMMQIPEKRKNVSASPIASTIVRKNCVTRKAAPQLAAVATETALPRTRLG